MIIHRPMLGFGIAALALTTMGAALAQTRPMYVYVGTYTGRNSNSKGIYFYRFDPGKRTLEAIGVAETPSPSFLAIDPARKFLYAANEISNYRGEQTGTVTAFRIDPGAGKLTELNTVASRGSGPAFVAVDRSGKNVLVANYGGGTVAVLPIADDGSLKEASGFQKHEGHSVNPRRQREPHAHSINLSPDNRFAIAADLGLDKLLVYRFDAAKGTLEPNDPPSISVAPGSGPRHFTFHPNGKYAYAINEMKSTVTAFDWDAKRGVLTEKQTVSTLPQDFTGESTTAEVVVHPNGRFLYGSNRGHDSIAVFSIAADGKLTPVEITPAKVKTPRNFALDPSGEYLFAAGQNSNNIVVFRVDGKTGKLTETNLGLQVGSPVCVRFVPAK